MGRPGPRAITPLSAVAIGRSESWRDAHRPTAVLGTPANRVRRNAGANRAGFTRLGIRPQIWRPEHDWLIEQLDEPLDWLPALIARKAGPRRTEILTLTKSDLSEKGW